MEGKQVILVKYGEISLRKGNRAIYERQLMDTIRRNLRDIGDGAIHVIREQGRFFIEDTRGDIDASAVLPKIRHIFGITAFCLCVMTNENDLNTLQRLGHSFLRNAHAPLTGSFKVETKRGDKRYPIPSQEVSAAVGEYILSHEPNVCVNLHHPDITLWIEIRTRTYIYASSIPGESGLPYGSSGRGVLLLSGGIDSPVAGYLMARRGVEIIPVYFHSPPYTSERAADKVMDITRRLSAYTGSCRLYIVPFTDVQLFLRDNVQPAKLTLLLKRAMLRIASELAVKTQSHTLITGDSVGQVASQTIHSLEAVHTASDFPVIRPLAAMDKQQIIDIALRIDTYDISIRPYEDCCTVFVAEHPESKPKASIIQGIEARFRELPDMLTDALNRAEIHDIVPF